MDLDAYYYQANSQQQYTRARELLTQHIFRESDRVLDVGCGDGRITAEIANWVPNGRVIGIDASSNMIQLARNSFPSAKFPNLEFYVVKAEEMSFVELFDKVVSLNCMLWVRKPREALNLMCNLLKAGGELLILTYLRESSYVSFLEETLNLFPQHKKLSAANTMLSAEDYKQILNSNNLNLDKFEVTDSISIFRSKDELRSYIKGWLYSYVALPQELQDSFLDQAIEKSLSYSLKTNDQNIGISYKSLIISARK